MVFTPAAWISAQIAEWSWETSQGLGGGGVPFHGFRFSLS